MPRPPDPHTGDTKQRAVGRVLDVLEAVVADGPVALTAVAQATGLTPTTARRFLCALDDRGYVRRDLQQRYVPGPALARVAAGVLASQSGADLSALAQPVLADLAARTGESSYLAVAAGDHARYVAVVESTRAIRHVGWAGRSVPLAGSAVGQALAGQRGACVRTGAVESDITAVAAAVPVGTRVVAAITAVGPSQRMRGARLAAIKVAVSDAADTLAGLLHRSSEVA